MTSTDHLDFTGTVPIKCTVIIVKCFIFMNTYTVTINKQANIIFLYANII